MLFALDTEDLISRKICWTIRNSQGAPIAMVFGSAHWIVVRGYTASAAPADYSDTSYPIDSFDVNNPRTADAGRKQSVAGAATPHTDGTDGCGTGGSRGLANENISYSTWQSTYMTGITGGYWNGSSWRCRSRAAADSARRAFAAADEAAQVPGRTVAGRQATARTEESLKAYGLATRDHYSQALGHTKFGEAVLVQRLDLPDTFYWIVLATEGSFNTLAVAVDAKSGLYMSLGRARRPGGSPTGSGPPRRWQNRSSGR